MKTYLTPFIPADYALPRRRAGFNIQAGSISGVSGDEWSGYDYCQVPLYDYDVPPDKPTSTRWNWRDESVYTPSENPFEVPIATWRF